MKTENWHGTRSGYNGRACRCEQCREAQRTYQADRSSARNEGARAKRNEYMRDYHAANRERLNAAARARRAADPDRYAAAEDRKRARRNGNPEFLAQVRDRRYGLAAGQFDAMLVAQGGRCSICLSEFAAGLLTPHVDHDHTCCPGQKSCGKCVRGLLCSPCNSAIGLLGDEPERVLRAGAYLERAR
jgi:hypothetical protein